MARPTSARRNQRLSTADMAELKRLAEKITREPVIAVTKEGEGAVITTGQGDDRSSKGRLLRAMRTTAGWYLSELPPTG